MILWLKLGIYTQLDSGSNMGWVPPGCTTSSGCVRLKIPKMLLQESYLDLGVRLLNPYIFEISFTWECFKYIYMVTPFPMFTSYKNGAFAGQTLGASCIKLGMHTQLDFGSKMG